MFASPFLIKVSPLSINVGLATGLFSLIVNQKDRM